MDSGVEFDTDVSAARPTGRTTYQSYAPQEASGGLSGWLMKRGLAKNARTATIILAIVIVLNVIIMYWAWHAASPSASSKAPFPGQHDIPQYVNAKPPR